ncbi:Hexokinase-3 [Mactra antiquata]
MSASNSEDALKSALRSSVARGSMMNKEIKGLTLDEVRDALYTLLPDNPEFVRKHIIEPFYVSDDDYKKVYKSLAENLEAGLDDTKHHTATLKMWPSYVRDLPDGTETGTFLALDFGSHHLKAEVVSLDHGKYEVDSMNGFVPEKILLHGDGEKLFDYLANFLHRFLKRSGLLNTTDRLPLGFTFAFPCKRLAINKAILTRWTKNLHCDGVVGEDVVAMLQAAIERRGEMNIECVASVNDTVGTLMSGAQEDPKCAIGVILSKGVNACYMEQLEKVGTWTEKQSDLPNQVVIDTEWSEFGDDGCLDFFRNDYDKMIDENHHKGKAIFEKMISGQYLGEIVRLVLEKMNDSDVLFQDHWTKELGTRNRFYTKYVSEILRYCLFIRSY